MIADIPVLTALAAGFISFVSPCVLPLVPPYLCYMAGASIEALSNAPRNETGIEAGKGASARAFPPALLFVVGFSSVFIALGAGASTIGMALRAHQDTLALVAGIAILAMGLHFLGIFRFGFLSREARFQGGGPGLAGSFVMGLAFAFGWTPCIGPVLGVILALAGSRETIGEGAGLLAVYSAGLGIPFLAAALFIGPFIRLLSRFRRHLGTVEKAMGVMLVATGILFLTGGLQRMSYWLLETFPALGLIG